MSEPDKQIESASAGRRRGRKVQWLVLTGLVLAIAVLVVPGGWTVWDISATCPKCLQQANIHKTEIFGIPVYQRIELPRNSGGLMGSAVLGPEVPPINPALYEQILGRPCAHTFVKGGAGQDCGYLFRIHKDSVFVAGFQLQPRIDALAALYGAYVRTDDGYAAAAIYAVIDQLFPPDSLAGRTILWPHATEEEVRQTYADTGAENRILLESTLQLHRLTRRLNEVETGEDFARLRREFESQDAER